MRLYLLLLTVMFFSNGCIYKKIRSNMYIKPETAVKDFEYRRGIKVLLKEENAIVLQLRTYYVGRIPDVLGNRLVELLVLIKDFDYAVGRVYKVDNQSVSYLNDFERHKGVEFERIYGDVTIKEVGSTYSRYARYIKLHLLLSFISNKGKTKVISKIITLREDEIYFGDRIEPYSSGSGKVETVRPGTMLQFLLENGVYERHE